MQAPERDGSTHFWAAWPTPCLISQPSNSASRLAVGPQCSMAYACRMTNRATTAIDTTAIGEVVQRALPTLQLLYLFGSRARGDAQHASDLDLAVLAQGPVDPVTRHQLRTSLEVTLGCDVDLVDLDRASTVLQLEVIRDGRLLQEKEAGQALAFEARVLSEYANLLDATKTLRHDIQQRGTVYAA